MPTPVQPAPGHIFTFGYGSNMCLGRMTCRVPSASPITVAELRGYRFRFNKRSTKDGSAKGNAIKSDDPNDRVLGVVFDVLEREMHWLDEAEGLNAGYNVEHLPLYGGWRRPTVYRPNIPRRDRLRRPPAVALQLVQAPRC